MAENRRRFFPFMKDGLGGEVGGIDLFIQSIWFYTFTAIIQQTDVMFSRLTSSSGD